ncbi:MAG: CDP-alcohol phosphatidyltransferase family protein [Silvibacterium sp.]
MNPRKIGQLRAAPNQLTLLRLCIIPFLVLSIFDHHYRTAFALFILAGITDGLDGLVARWLQQRTVLGQYLDPMADKLLLSTLFLVLHHEGLISLLVTVLVFGRDLGIIMVAAILYASVGIKDFRPSLFGKANTLAQIVALLTVLLCMFYAPPLVVLVRHWSLVATVVFTVASGFHYSWLITRRLSAPAGPVSS